MNNPTSGTVRNKSNVLKFTKKPVTIEAIRWTGENLVEVITFTDGHPNIRSQHAGMMWDNYVDLVAKEGLKIFTLEGKMNAEVGDWIIKGVKGEFYPCKPDIFEKTYTLNWVICGAEPDKQPELNTGLADTSALSCATEIMALYQRQWPGGDCQLKAAIQCAIIDLIEPLYRTILAKPADHSAQTLDMVRPAELQQEPVAWVSYGPSPILSEGEIHHVWHARKDAERHVRGVSDWKIAPLYRHPPAQQRTEEQEQDAFESVNPMPQNTTRFRGGYAATEFNAWDAHKFCNMWDGWKARAALDTGAVKLPERKDRSKRYWFDLDAHEKVEEAEAKGYNACLDEVARINGIKS